MFNGLESDLRSLNFSEIVQMAFKSKMTSELSKPIFSPYCTQLPLLSQPLLSHHARTSQILTFCPDTWTILIFFRPGIHDTQQSVAVFWAFSDVPSLLTRKREPVIRTADLGPFFPSSRTVLGAFLCSFLPVKRRIFLRPAGLFGTAEWPRRKPICPSHAALNSLESLSSMCKTDTSLNPSYVIERRLSTLCRTCQYGGYHESWYVVTRTESRRSIATSCVDFILTPHRYRYGRDSIPKALLASREWAKHGIPTNAKIIINKVDIRLITHD